MTRPLITLIVARAGNGVIGHDGALPWPRLQGDLPRFKALTMGKPCIMGRKTWDSLPKKPLPGRRNIVVTRQTDFAAEGATVVHSLDEALDAAANEAPSEIMVIGGADLFAQALMQADKIELTVVYGTPQGDVVMPDFSPCDWRETARQKTATHDYVTLVRITDDVSV